MIILSCFFQRALIEKFLKRNLMKIKKIKTKSQLTKFKIIKKLTLRIEIPENLKVILMENKRNQLKKSKWINQRLKKFQKKTKIKGGVVRKYHKMSARWDKIIFNNKKKFCKRILKNIVAKFAVRNFRVFKLWVDMQKLLILNLMIQKARKTKRII